MIVEDRRRKKYSKATGVLSAVLGADVLFIALVSRSSFTSLVTLSAEKISVNNFVLLDVIGVAAALVTSFLLLRFKHFSKISFGAMCGFSIFFGLILPLLQVLHSPSTWFSLVMVEGAVALALTGAVMVLSMFTV
jgi:hypothetical protein